VGALSKASPKEARGGMQVTYFRSKMKGACSRSVGLAITLQIRSSDEDAATKMTAWRALPHAMGEDDLAGSKN